MMVWFLIVVVVWMYVFYVVLLIVVVVGSVGYFIEIWVRNSEKWVKEKFSILEEWILR